MSVSDETIAFYTGKRLPGYEAMLGKVKEYGLSVPHFEAAAERLRAQIECGDAEVEPISYFSTIKRMMRDVDAGKHIADMKLLKRSEQIIKGWQDKSRENAKMWKLAEFQLRGYKRSISKYKSDFDALRASLRAYKVWCFAGWASAITIVLLWAGTR